MFLEPEGHGRGVVRSSATLLMNKPDNTPRSDTEALP
jgi:hypothetical protein